MIASKLVMSTTTGGGRIHLNFQVGFLTERHDSFKIVNVPTTGGGRIHHYFLVDLLTERHYYLKIGNVPNNSGWSYSPQISSRPINRETLLS